MGTGALTGSPTCNSAKTIRGQMSGWPILIRAGDRFGQTMWEETGGSMPRSAPAPVDLRPVCRQGILPLSHTKVALPLPPGVEGIP